MRNSVAFISLRPAGVNERAMRVPICLELDDSMADLEFAIAEKPLPYQAYVHVTVERTASGLCRVRRGDRVAMVFTDPTGKNPIEDIYDAVRVLVTKDDVSVHHPLDHFIDIIDRPSR